MRPRFLSTLLAALLLFGCQAPLPLPPVQEPGADASLLPRLVGRAEFPASLQVAATQGDVINRATVSVLDAAGQTVAVTLTDSAGNFTLDANGSFTPVTGAFYTVEAVKGIRAGDGATRAVRMQTLLSWSGSAWNSCTGAASIGITPTTTAVALIKARQGTVTYPETMGIVTGATVTSANATLTSGWQAVRDLAIDLLAKDQDPVSRIALNGNTWGISADRVMVLQPQLPQGTFDNTWNVLDGSVQLKGSMPRPKVEDEESFTPAGLAYSGLIVTDGVHLYARKWDNASEGYNKIGSGFGGTTAGAMISTFPALTGALGAGAFGGYIYHSLNGAAGSNATLQKVSTSTGAISTVTLDAPLLFRDTALPTSGGNYCFFVTDGTLFYNLAYTINGGGYNGYTVRVYEPSGGNFKFLRQFIMDGANTTLAGTSYYTDGVLADGAYLYPMEWEPGHKAVRIRRYRISDGQLELESRFTQDHPDVTPISGCYDKANNKFWFGSYVSGTIHRTAGRVFPAYGLWTSAPLDTGASAPLYANLSFRSVAVNGQTIKFQVRSAPDPEALSTATWYGPTGTGDYYAASGTPLNPVHRGQRWVQFKATLTPDTTAMLTNTPVTPAANTTPRLYGVSLEVLK